MKKLRAVEWLIVHHSASRRDTTPLEIRQWHKERGWDDIGYHYVIGDGGVLYPGRAWPYAGAHARGRNSNSIGICLTGDNTQPGQGWTLEQIDALRLFWERFNALHPKAELVGHRDVSGNTLCPGLDVRELVLGGNGQSMQTALRGE